MVEEAREEEEEENEEGKETGRLLKKAKEVEKKLKTR